MSLLYSGLTIPPAAALNGAVSDAGQRQISAAGARSAAPVLYGEDRIGGLLLNILPAAANSPTLLVQVLWGHALDSINDVRLNDQALPAGSTVTHYTGGQSTADAALVSAFAAQSITYTDTLAGFGYSVLAIPTRAFEGSLAITARVRGRRLYDVRQDSTQGGSGPQRLATPSTWTWSDNPALALADWLASSTYGCGSPVDWASVAAAANHCDDLVGTPAERRRVIGLGLVTPASVEAVAQTLRAHAGCWLVPSASGVRLLPDQDAAPVATYTHAGGDIAQLEPLTLRDNSSAPTVVEILYTDTTKVPYREAIASASLPGVGTTRPVRLSQVRMPGVQRFSQANREAIERLNKLTLGDLSTVVEVFDIGIRHEIGDIVSISHPVGLVAKPFRIAEPPEMVSHGRWRLPLVEHDPAVYSSVVQTQPSVPDAGFVSPAGPPGAVTGFTSATEQVGIRLRWAPNPESDVVQYQLRLGGTNWATATPLDGTAQTIVGGTTHLWPQPAAGTYTFRIRAQDLDGNLSVNDATTTITVGALAVGSQGPQGPAGTSGTQTATVYLYQWGTGTAPGDPTSSTSWDWATAAHSGTPGGGWSTALPANPGTAGLLLWVAQRALTASAAATTSTVTWAPGSFTKQSITTNGATGPQGVPGVRTGYARAFQWSLAPAPTTTGSATYTWATGAVSALPTGSGTWVAAPTSSPSPGLTLWQAEVALVDSSTVLTSAVNWTTASVRAVGFAGANGAAGAPGSQGVSARVAYSLATGGVGALASTPASVSVAGDNRPGNGQWGSGTVWVVATPAPAAGESVWVTDGLFDPVANTTTWYAPYLASLRVGQLSAISANLGEITAGSIQMTAGRTGIAADGYATFRGLRIEDEAGNVVLQTRASGPTQLPETWIGNLNANKITAGEFGANRIAAGAITARHITVTDSTNLVTNNRGDAGVDGWAPSDGPSFSAQSFSFWPASFASGHAFAQACRDAFYGPWINVRPGDQFFLSWDSLPYGGGGMNFNTGFGVHTQNATGGSDDFVYVAGRAAALTGSLSLNGVYTVPASGVARLRPWIQVNKPFANLSNAFGDAIYFTNVIFRRRSGGELIVDGSISANKLTIGASGPGTNLILNPQFGQDADGWRVVQTNGTAPIQWTRIVYGAAFALQSPSAGGGSFGVGYKAVPVSAGKRYRFRVRAGRVSPSGAGDLFVIFNEANATSAAGKWAGIGDAVDGVNVISRASSQTLVAATLTTSVAWAPNWDGGTVFEGEYIPTAGTSFVTMGVYAWVCAPGQGVYLYEASLAELVGSVIIEDGAITAPKVNAQAITTEALQIGSAGATVRATSTGVGFTISSAGDYLDDSKILATLPSRYASGTRRSTSVALVSGNIQVRTSTNYFGFPIQWYRMRAQIGFTLGGVAFNSVIDDRWFYAYTDYLVIIPFSVVVAIPSNIAFDNVSPTLTLSDCSVYSQNPPGGTATIWNTSAVITATVIGFDWRV